MRRHRQSLPHPNTLVWTWVECDISIASHWSTRAALTAVARLLPGTSAMMAALQAGSTAEQIALLFGSAQLPVRCKRAGTPLRCTCLHARNIPQKAGPSSVALPRPSLCPALNKPPKFREKAARQTQQIDGVAAPASRPEARERAGGSGGRGRAMWGPMVAPVDDVLPR